MCRTVPGHSCHFMMQYSTFGCILTFRWQQCGELPQINPLPNDQLARPYWLYHRWSVVYSLASPHLACEIEKHVEHLPLASRAELTSQTIKKSIMHNQETNVLAMAEVDLLQCLRVAREAALAAGAIIKQNFGCSKLHVEQKSSHVDLVTETDKKCEDVIKSMLQQHFPHHKFIGEETAAANGGQGKLTDEPTWMVDPLDGTTNFVHSYPFTCVSIGLTVGRTPVVGVVHNPLMGELFHAVQGGGAYLNDKPISVSDTAELRAGLFATEVGTMRSPETVAAVFDRIQTLIANMRSVRACGSCALNLAGVACGRLDAFYEIGFGGCWDVAAGACILVEAGGQVLDPTGGPWDVMSRRVLGANAHLGPGVAKLLAGCKISSEEPQPPAATATAAECGNDTAVPPAAQQS